MDEQNSKLGFLAGNSEDFDSEEKFSIYHNEKKNVDISADELTDFVDSFISDMPELTDEEINEGVEKILAKACVGPEAVKPAANNTKLKK